MRWIQNDLSCRHSRPGNNNRYKFTGCIEWTYLNQNSYNRRPETNLSFSLHLVACCRMHELLTLLVIWLFLYVGITGAGHLFYNSTSIFLRDSQYPRHVVVFWTGFSLLIALLQILQIFVPLGTYTAISLFIISLAGYFRHRNNLFQHISSIKNNSFPEARPGNAAYLASQSISLLFAGATVLLITYAVLYTATAALHVPVTWYDTSLYHWQVVTWFQDYHIVPGLANLHFRLGYNSSLLLFAALSAQGSWKLLSPHIAMGFLVAALLGHWIYLLYSILKQRYFTPFLILAIAGIIYLAFQFDNNEVNSLSTDLAMAVFSLATITLYLIEYTGHNGNRIGTFTNYPAAIAVMATAATAVTVKLSAIPGAILFFIYLVYLVIRKTSPSVNRFTLAIALFLLPALLCAGYFTRLILISGWFFYPVPVGNLHLPWSMPAHDVITQYHWLLSWARMPMKSPEIVLNNGFEFWFKPWFRHFKGSMEYQLLIYSMPALLLFSIAGSFWERGRKILYHCYLLPVIYPIASILYWFTFAPDLRFGSVFYFLLAGITASLGIHLIVPACGRFKSGSIWHLFIIATISLFAILFPLKRVEHSLLSIREIPDSYPGYPAMKSVVIDKCSSIPLSVLVPVKGNQCGAAPIPCTPYPHPLRLVKSGDLQSGFLPGKQQCMADSN